VPPAGSSLDTPPKAALGTSGYAFGLGWGQRSFGRSAPLRRGAFKENLFYLKPEFEKLI